MEWSIAVSTEMGVTSFKRTAIKSPATGIVVVNTGSLLWTALRLLGVPLFSPWPWTQ
jgi:hypothetical protein